MNINMKINENNETVSYIVLSAFYFCQEANVVRVEDMISLLIFAIQKFLFYFFRNLYTRNETVLMLCTYESLQTAQPTLYENYMVNNSFIDLYGNHNF